MSTCPAEWVDERELQEQRQRAFNDLVESHAGSLLGKACRLTRNRADAEDLMQETLMRAYRHIDCAQGLERAERAASWLHAILKNTFITGYRRRRGRPVPASLDHEHLVLVDRAPQPTVGFVADHPDVPAEYGIGDEVKLALAKLPREYRTVLLLAGVECYKYREIAAILGCPVGTVMSRLFRARRRMLSELSGRVR